MIRIYNTLTRKKEDFVPLEEGKVRMYVCGPTVYNFIHIGNATEDLLDVKGLPAGFRQLKVTFRVDDIYVGIQT